MAGLPDLTIETGDILDQLRNIFRLALETLSADVENAYARNLSDGEIGSIIDDAINEMIGDFDVGYDHLVERRIRSMQSRGVIADDVSDELLDTIDDIKEAQIANIRTKAQAWKSSIARTSALDRIPGVVAPGRVGAIIADDIDSLIVDTERAGITYARVLESAASGSISIDNRGEIVQSDESGWRYLYEGPEDDRNRPHCAHYVNKTLTRKEIDDISPSQFFLCGDDPEADLYLPEASESAPCRHNWVLIDKGE